MERSAEREEVLFLGEGWGGDGERWVTRLGLFDLLRLDRVSFLIGEALFLFSLNPSFERVSACLRGLASAFTLGEGSCMAPPLFTGRVVFI